MQNSILTPRLLIRPLKLGDSAAVHAYRSDRGLMQHQTWIPETEAEVKQFIRGMQGVAPGIPGIWFQFAIVRQHDGTLLGDCGIHVPLETVDGAELGMTLARPYHGYGYATEALCGLIGFCFETLHLRRLFARTTPTNTRSIQLVDRCAFRPAQSSGYGFPCEDDERFFVLERSGWSGQETT